MSKPQLKTLSYYDIDEVLAYLEEKYGADTIESVQEILDYFDYELPTVTFITYEDKHKLYYMAPIFVEKKEKEFAILTEEFGPDFNLNIGD